jgi:hypothetical protein
VVIQLTRIALVIALLLCEILSNSGIAEDHADIMKQDSGTNLSEINFTLTVSPTYGSAQTVKFTAPKKGWVLEGILIMASDGYNSSSNGLPKPLPFAVEIRDSKLRLLYHYSDIQLPYFSAIDKIRMAFVEIPDMPMNGDFFVCFYGYRSIGLATELQNSTGKSYLYDKVAGHLYSSDLPLINNETLPINYLIRVVGK